MENVQDADSSLHYATAASDSYRHVDLALVDTHMIARVSDLKYQTAERIEEPRQLSMGARNEDLFNMMQRSLEREKEQKRTMQ